jgi:4-amino-4-deoxy-L-arabinose transferase-like glycosyltransferase
VSARRHLLVLLGLVAVLLFAGLGATALTDRDEGANAEAAREMLELRSWVTPALNYFPRFVKPALVYWLMAAAYAALGATEAAARLPSAIAGAALVAIQYAFARWVFGSAIAFRAALVLLLSIEVVAIARMALTDAVLVVCTTAAGFAFFRAFHGEPPRGRWYVATYAALGLGLLTKGPVGVLVPVLGIAAYLALAGGWRRVWREARPAWGLVLLLAVGGPWYGAMLWTHGGVYLARARGETVGRVLRTVTGPGGTVLFYVPVLLIGFFPWSAFLPGALVGALRGARARAAADRAGAATVFTAAWFVAGLALFSLVPSRLPHYVAPLFPAAALLVAAAWPAGVPRLARGLLAALGVGLGGGIIAAGLMGSTVARLLAPAYPADAGASLPPSVYVLGMLALAIGATAALRDAARLFSSLAILTTALLVVGLHVVFPGFSTEFLNPAGELIRTAARLARPCDRLVAVGPYRPSLIFYARRPVTFVGVHDRIWIATLAAAPGRLLVLVPRASVDRLPPALAGLRPLDTRGGYVLLASPPDGC